MILCNLKGILEDRGMTQKELARAVYAHENTISDLCNNKTTRVNIDLLDEICQYLNISLFELLLYRRNEHGK